MIIPFVLRSVKKEPPKLPKEPKKWENRPWDTVKYPGKEDGFFLKHLTSGLFWIEKASKQSLRRYKLETLNQKKCEVIIVYDVAKRLLGFWIPSNATAKNTRKYLELIFQKLVEDGVVSRLGRITVHIPGDVVASETEAFKVIQEFRS